MICPECNGRGESIYYIETHCDENSVTVKQRKEICRTCNGSGKKQRTNADRIRAMSDEELADVVANGVGCVLKAPHCIDDDCTPCIRKWLQQPAEGE